MKLRSHLCIEQKWERGPDRVNLVGEDPRMEEKSFPRPRTLSLQFQALDGQGDHW